MQLLWLLFAIIPSLLWADSDSAVDLAPEILGISQQSFLRSNKSFVCQKISPTVQLSSCVSSKASYLGQRWDSAYATFANGKLVGIELKLKSLESLRSSETFRQAVYSLTSRFGPPLKLASNVDDNVLSEALWQPLRQGLLRVTLGQSTVRARFEISMQLVSIQFAQEPTVPASPARQ